MPDQSKWAVPIAFIKKSWWSNYKDHGDVKQSDFDDSECEDWATNNMNWDDVEAVAKELKDEHEPVDYDEGWTNGEKEFRD